MLISYYMYIYIMHMFLQFCVKLAASTRCIILYHRAVKKHCATGSKNGIEKEKREQFRETCNKNFVQN